MKKNLLFLVMLISLSTWAQTDTSGIKFIDLPDSTGFGTPNGKLVTKEIGASGGMIASEDGRIELIFPEGALTTNATLRIQPVTNLAPNGTGKAYLFEPSGIQFNKPVQIVFRFTDEEAEICPPDLMGFAMQDHIGKWSFVEYEGWDSISKILKGLIHHFSRFSNVNKLQLELEKKEVSVKGKVSVRVVDISRRWGREMEGLSLEGQYRIARIDGTAPVLWFMAPEFLPNKNPVTISVDVYVFSEKKHSFSRKRILIGKISIFDEYKVRITAVWDNTNIRPNLGTTRWVDSAGFDIRFGTKSEISNIENSLFQLVEEHFTPTCEFSFPNKTTCIGPIHVSGIKGTGISYGSGSTYATATIDFEQRQNIVVPIIQIISCRGRRAAPLPQLGMINAFPALPNKIKFELKDETQTIEIKDNAVAQLGKIEIVVRRTSPPANN